MKPPRSFKYNSKRGYSLCEACQNWKYSNALFHHEGRDWTLCEIDYEDYWYNTDELLPDYKWNWL